MATHDTHSHTHALTRSHTRTVPWLTWGWQLFALDGVKGIVRWETSLSSGAASAPSIGPSGFVSVGTASGQLVVVFASAD